MYTTAKQDNFLRGGKKEIFSGQEGGEGVV